MIPGKKGGDILQSSFSKLCSDSGNDLQNIVPVKAIPTTFYTEINSVYIYKQPTGKSAGIQREPLSSSVKRTVTYGNVKYTIIAFEHHTSTAEPEYTSKHIRACVA